MKKIVMYVFFIISLLIYPGNASELKVASVAGINTSTGEIVINIISGHKVMMGDILYISNEDNKIPVEVVFPMMTSAKCRLFKKDIKQISLIKKGDTIYSGYNEDDKKVNLKSGLTDGFDPADFIKNEIVRIEGGTFSMGSSIMELDRDEDEYKHNVTLQPFMISKHEISQKIWEAVMGVNNSRFQGGNLPVENVSWYEAVEFCNKLSQMSKLKPCYTIIKNRKDSHNKNEEDNVKYTVLCDFKASGYRLPTEAEWEYACRGGKDSATHYGMGISGNEANFNGNYTYNTAVSLLGISLSGTYHATTVPIGNYQPNNYGLFDMHGNVREWCWDWYDELFYLTGTDENPSGPDSGSHRVTRGGDWESRGALLRSAKRQYMIPSGKDKVTGFRICKNID